MSASFLKNFYIKSIKISYFKFMSLVILTLRNIDSLCNFSFFFTEDQVCIVMFKLLYVNGIKQKNAFLTKMLRYLYSFEVDVIEIEKV